MKIKAKYFMYIGYCLFVLSYVFIETELNSISRMSYILRALKYVGVFLCIFSCSYCSRIDKGKLTYFLFLLTLALANMIFVNGGSGLIEILIVVFCITVMKANVRDIFKCEIVTLLVGHVFVMFLSLIGVLNNNVTSRWFGNYMGSFFAGEYIRHQMGFLASNQVPLSLMIIYLMVIVYRKNRVKLYEHILFLVANFFCFNYFGSRVSFILIIVTFIWYEYVFLSPKKNKKKFCVMWVIYVLCSMISLFSACMYSESSRIWITLNEIFYNRIKWSHAAIEKYGISIIGYGLSAGKATGYYGENLIDNAYILMLIQKGLLISLFVILFWSYLTYMAEKENNSFLTIALVIIAVASLIDDHLITYKMIPFYVIGFQCDYSLCGCQRLHVKQKKHIISIE